VHPLVSEEQKTKVSGILSFKSSPWILRRDAILDYFLFALISFLLVTIWFRDGLIIGGGDEWNWFYNPLTHLAYRKYALLDLPVPGAYEIPSIPFIPFVYLLSLLQSLVSASYILQAATFFLLMVTSAISMYNLTWTALPSNEKSRLAAIFSALFYILNPYTMSSVWHRGIVGIMFTMPLLPTVLFILFKYKNRKSVISLSLYVSLVLLLFTPAFAHTPEIVPVWLAIFTYLLFDALFGNNVKKNMINALEIFVFSLGLWIVFSAWWMLPAISEYIEPFFWATGKETFQWWPSPLFDVIRLFHSSYRIERPFYPIYTSPIFEAISFIIPFTTFLAVIFRPKDKNVLFFVCLSLLGLFLAKGASPPLGEEVGQLLGSSPLWIFFKLIRDSYDKLGSLVSLGYSYLFGVSLSAIYNLRQRITSNDIIQPISKFNRRRITAAALVLTVAIPILVVYPWPMWTGDIWFSSFTGSGRIIRATIDPPFYYEEARHWLETQPKGRIISLPISYGSITLDWSHPYEGHDPRPLIFGKPTLAGYAGGNNSLKMIELLSVDVRRNYAWKLMNLFGARYIVVNKDVDNRYRPPMKSPEEMENALKHFLVPGGEGSHIYDHPLSSDFEILYGIDSRIENDTVNEVQCIRFDATSQGEQKAVGLRYMLKDKPINSSNLNFLSIWIRTTTTGRLQIAALDRGGGGVNWDGRFQPEYSISKNEVGLWKRIDLDFHSPTSGPTPPEIWIIQIVMQEAESRDPISIWIRSIEASPGLKVRNPHISTVASFDNLTFYKIEDEYFVDKIYTADKILGIVHHADIFEYLREENVTVRGTIFLRETDLAGLEKMGALGSTLLKPSIKFTETSPSTYKVDIINATQPFFLVSSESYHPKWEAHVDGATISSERHFLANGYANAWYIDKRGSYVITLEFAFERTVELGLIISTTGFAAVSALYGVRWLYKRKIKNK